MLLIDGDKYERWMPASEEAFEEIVKEHAHDIFGDNSAYLDIKHKLIGSEIASIPDAYAITFDPDKLWIVELELSTHNVYDHIMPQLGKFLAALSRSATRDKLCNLLFNELQARSNVKETLGQRGEIHRFVFNLLTNPPHVLVIIDRLVPGLEDLEVALSADVTICEFATFCKEDLGLAAHCHQFEPLYLRSTYDYRLLWQSLIDGVKRHGIVAKNRINERGYQPISTGKAGIHFEWIAYHDALGVELHFERADPAVNRRLLKMFEQKKLEIEEKVNEPVLFDHSFHGRWTRLLMRKATVGTETPPRLGDAIRQWGVETMVKLYTVCKPLVDNLNP